MGGKTVNARCAWGGLSSAGHLREVNEDAVHCVDLSEDASLFVVADGMGSLPSGLQPAQIAASWIAGSVERLYGADRDLLVGNASLLMKECLLAANGVIGSFAMADEERYAGFGASVTACLVHGGSSVCIAHSGNTRLYLIRGHPQDGSPIMRRLTRDHTKAMELVDDGVISEEQCHTHPGRLILTGGLGKFALPEIQTFEGSLKGGDIILMTTDGIHCCLRPDAMLQIVMESESCGMAASGLVQASIEEKYADNMSAVMAYILP